MTVSRVLNGTVRVSEETAKRVHKAIEQLKYRPNHLARVFRSQRSQTIGLIIPYLYDPFFANCAHAVTTVAKEHWLFRHHHQTLMTRIRTPNISRWSRCCSGMWTVW